jgi:predicted GTPase
LALNSQDDRSTAELKESVSAMGVNAESLVAAVQAEVARARNLAPCADLVEWYNTEARPFFERFEESRLRELDADRERLIAAASRLTESVVVCLLGNSGVGKSTLLNALVAGKEIVLPAGGLGPLTAQALSVYYGDTPAFEIAYHAPQNLWRLVFALEQTHANDLKSLARNIEDDIIREYGEILGTEDAISTADSDDPKPNELARQYRSLAQLIVKGSTERQADVAYLADSLRSVLGKDRKWQTTASHEDAERLTRVRSAIDLAKKQATYRRGAGRSVSDNDDFVGELRQHAAGFLAPLIKELKLFWPSPVLSSGLVLVDLPGVGIVGDPHRDITRAWIRQKAKGIVLVVDHRGLTEADADLLRTSEFLNRLLYSVDDPTADPVSLTVVVSKVDDIAETLYAENRSKKKWEHFVDVCSEATSKVRNQVRAHLGTIWSSSDDNVNKSQKQVVDNIIERLQVYSVSAIQYRKILAADEEDRAFVRDIADSHVPDVAQGLLSLAEGYKRDREAGLAAIRELFSSRVVSSLRLLEAKWQEQPAPSAESQKLRDDLTAFNASLQKKYYMTQGQFEEFLKKGIPERIDALVSDARRTSAKEIFGYLNTLQGAHWATLRAAVRRGGTYYGALHIDLPRDFALRFEEPVADVWGKNVLREIRSRTRAFSEGCAALVNELAGWALSQGTRVQPRLVEAQATSIGSDLKRLESVGRDAVNDLREVVKNGLIEAIEGPIRRKCKQFVDRNEHLGRGTKDRILKLFYELAEDVSESASAPARRILRDCFRAVETEIEAVAREQADPLTAMTDAIVHSHELRTKKSDEQKRKRVVGELHQLLSAPAVAQLERRAGGAAVIDSGPQRALPEHGRVRLLADLTARDVKLPAGSEGAIVSVYEDGEAYAVEFVYGLASPVVVTLTRSQVAPISP